MPACLMMMKVLAPHPHKRWITTTCELCSSEAAAVYCASDIASLCWSCDAKVHHANFLVARHVRRVICSTCKCFTGIRLSGGACFRPPPPPSLIPICPSCTNSPASDDDDDSFSSSSSSSPSSSASSSTTGRNKIHSESDQSGGIMIMPTAFESPTTTIMNSQKTNKGRSRSHLSHLHNIHIIYLLWCRRLGIHPDQEALLVKAASEAFRRRMKRRKSIINSWGYIYTAAVMPFKICLAASFWFGYRFCRWDGRRTSISPCLVAQFLQRLEQISGVPAKLISAAQSKLESLCKLPIKNQRPHHQLDEGWAECSA